MMRATCEVHFKGAAVQANTATIVNRYFINLLTDKRVVAKATYRNPSSLSCVSFVQCFFVIFG